MKLWHKIQDFMDDILFFVDESSHLFLCESDLKCALYWRLVEHRRYFSKKIKHTNMLHTEYQCRKGGRYDMALIEPKDGHVIIGIELKFQVNATLERIYELIYQDAYKFNNMRNTSDYGLILFVNKGGLYAEQREELERKLIRLKEKKNLKNVMFYYIEKDGKNEVQCIYC